MDEEFPTQYERQAMKCNAFTEINSNALYVGRYDEIVQ